MFTFDNCYGPEALKAVFNLPLFCSAVWKCLFVHNHKAVFECLQPMALVTRWVTAAECADASGDHAAECTAPF